MKLTDLTCCIVILILLIVTPVTSDDRQPSPNDNNFVENREKRTLMTGMMDAMFGNFKNVSMRNAFQEIQSKKVVSYTIARDTTQVGTGCPLKKKCYVDFICSILWYRQCGY